MGRKVDQQKAEGKMRDHHDHLSNRTSHPFTPIVFCTKISKEVVTRAIPEYNGSVDPFTISIDTSLPSKKNLNDDHLAFLVPFNFLHNGMRMVRRPSCIIHKVVDQLHEQFFRAIYG